MVKIKRITYGVTDKGKTLGEHHHRAKITDRHVELIRDLYEEGMVGYRTLSRAFKIPRSTIQDLCTYRRRCTTPDSYKTKIVPVMG